MSTEVWYTSYTTYTLCGSNGENPSCSDSIPIPDSIYDHLHYFDIKFTLFSIIYFLRYSLISDFFHFFSFFENNLPLTEFFSTKIQLFKQKFERSFFNIGLNIHFFLKKYVELTSQHDFTNNW